MLYPDMKIYVDVQLKCNIAIERGIARSIEKYQSDFLNLKQTDAIPTDAK